MACRLNKLPESNGVDAGRPRSRFISRIRAAFHAKLLMIRYIFITLIIVGFWCSGCSRQSARLTTLPDGEKIKTTSIVPMHFSKGPDALVLNCETDIPIDDAVNLRKQVAVIWTVFRKDVEGASMSNGVIRITHPDGSGLVTHSKGYGFVFEKRADGQRHCLQDENK